MKLWWRHLGFGARCVAAGALGIGALGEARADPAVVVDVQVSNDTVFTDGIDNANVWLAVGDLTNDGQLDLVVTKGLDGLQSGGAQVAVFQGGPGAWDAGTRLAGPDQSTAYYPVVGPALNDSTQCLVYSEHRRGNTGGLARSLAYSGTTLVASDDVTDQIAWPYKSAPALADLEDDGELDVWVNYEHGSVPDAWFHLQRYTWDASAGLFVGGDVAQGGIGDEPDPPLVGDFAGDGTTTLVWLSALTELSLVRHVPGTGYSSTPIFTGDIFGSAAGEVDGLPGDDVVVLLSVSSNDYRVVRISGGTLTATELVAGVERLNVSAIADFDGDGLGEIYVGAHSGKVFRYAATTGWTQLHTAPGVSWSHAVTVRWPGAATPSVLLAGTTTGTGFQVLSIDAAPASPPGATTPATRDGSGGGGCQVGGKTASLDGVGLASVGALLVLARRRTGRRRPAAA